MTDGLLSQARLALRAAAAHRPTAAPRAHGLTFHGYAVIVQPRECGRQFVLVAEAFPMTAAPVTYEARDGGGWITLNRPEVPHDLATDDAVLGLGATLHGLVPDGAVLRLARVIGVGRAKELALLNDHVSPAEARAIGLVNWVCAPGDLDRTLASVVAKARSAAPTATAHTKRLLHESFHRDPRAILEEVLLAQAECGASWEMDEANRAWRETRDARFYPPPDGPSRDG